MPELSGQGLDRNVTANLSNSNSIELRHYPGLWPGWEAHAETETSLTKPVADHDPENAVRPRDLFGAESAGKNDVQTRRQEDDREEYPEGYFAST